MKTCLHEQTYRTIAIDGPAGAGKSTAAKMLAERLGFFLLDTGALYRVMALHLVRQGISPEAGRIPLWALSLDLTIEPGIASMKLFLDKEDVTGLLRDESIGIAASKFSARPDVRGVLLDLQRRAGKSWNLVAEGRDTGTVVFPDAAVKFFVTANLKERSHRRFQELVQRGEHPEWEKVFEEMRARDHRDKTRREAPLVKAPDAVEIDTTHLDPQEVLTVMLGYVTEHMNRVCDQTKAQ
ncbi:MAG TPA: (d)CMP kinase [Desulfomonilaceae bacterium]|nr:(d)CMP kinase [Desulfomonilaceae bacterium]